MKTFFEHFLEEVQRRLEAGEIDHDKAQRWIADIRAQLQDYSQYAPNAPIVQMPVRH